MLQNTAQARKYNDTHAKDWDTNNSFYRWMIYYPSGYESVGYSKKNGKPEVHSKIKLLMRCLVRLKKPFNHKMYGHFPFGYFSKGKIIRIELYKRTDLGEYREKLCTFFPEHYELSNNQKFNENRSFREFFEKFYAMIKAGTINELGYSEIGYSKVDEDEIFSLAAGKFQTIPDLQKYGNDLMLDGWEYERVKHFLRKYVEQNLSF